MDYMSEMKSIIKELVEIMKEEGIVELKTPSYEIKLSSVQLIKAPIFDSPDSKQSVKNLLDETTMPSDEELLFSSTRGLQDGEISIQDLMNNPAYLNYKASRTPQ